MSEFISANFLAVKGLLEQFGLTELLVAVFVALGSVLVALFAMIGKLRKHFHARTVSRIRVEALRADKKDDLEGFQDLYERLIKDDHKIGFEEMVAWLNDPGYWDGLQTRIFICKRFRRVVAFTQLMFCPRDRFIFISYLGVDEGDAFARRQASKALAAEIQKFATKNLKSASAVLFEVESPGEPGISEREITERRARIRRFKELASNIGLKAIEPAINYIQPEFPTDSPRSNQRRMCLFFVPLNGEKIMTRLERGHTIEMLRFIYFRVYGPSYRQDELLNRAYRSELLEKMKLFRKSVPLSVEVK